MINYEYIRFTALKKFGTPCQTKCRGKSKAFDKNASMLLNEWKIL